MGGRGDAEKGNLKLFALGMERFEGVTLMEGGRGRIRLTFASKG